MAEVKIRQVEILHDSHHQLKKVHFDKKKKDDSWKSQEKEVYDHGNAAAVLLYDKERRTILFTRQFRLPTYLNGNSSGMLLEACAGLLEKNESPDETIKREIEEETGYKVDSVQKVYEAYASAGYLTELLYLYVAEYKKEQKISKGGGLEEEGEEIEIVEMDFNEALQILDAGEIRDAKTLILLQYLQLKQLL